MFSEIIERLGSGIQAAPRDALIADLSHKSKLGASLGFCKSLKTLGGVLGGIVATIIIWLSLNNYNLLFGLSTIPAILAFLCIIKIKNTSAKLPSDIKKFNNPFQKKYLRSMDKVFWKTIVLAFICEAGHFGESLLTLRSTQFLSQTLAGMTSIFAAFGQIVFSYYIGIASDKIDRALLIKINLILIIISYFLMFCNAEGILFLLSVSILCGQYASMQLLFLSLINTHVSINLRGTAIGIFYCTIGLAYLLSTNICGFLCDKISYDFAFLYTLLVSITATLVSYKIKTNC